MAENSLMFAPAEIAKNYIKIGVGKATQSAGRMFLLGVMAGAFIAIGGIASTIAGAQAPWPALGKLLGAIVFPGGLAMVLLAGSELFTGNCLLIIPLLEKKINLRQLLKSWGLVYLGNLVGGVLVAAMVVFAHTGSLFENGVAASMVSTAVTKCSLPFWEAFFKGVLCNFLVCIAVWISFAAKSVGGKIAGIFFPIMMFVLCGFEHSVANMYYISAGMFANMLPEYSDLVTDTSMLNIGGFLGGNLLPVTLGNIVGGAVFVGLVYWLVYLKKTTH